jgi:hypothetical protein
MNCKKCVESDALIEGSLIHMRALKVVLLTLAMTTSLVAGVVGTADAASHAKAQPMSLWCC